MILHASSVAFGDKGLLILGVPGSGKSRLALRLIAYGAALVADDGVEILPGADGMLLARSPGRIRGMIEARGVGLLQLEPVEPVELRFAVDLDRPSSARLPEREHITLLGRKLLLISGGNIPDIDVVLSILLQKGKMVET
jgi:HPr kinase/phosphorylase